MSSQRGLHIAIKQPARLTAKRNGVGKSSCAEYRPHPDRDSAPSQGQGTRCLRPLQRCSAMQVGCTAETYGEHLGADRYLARCWGCGCSRNAVERDFLDWWREHLAKSRGFGSVCTSALVLAQAGLLDGRRATIHWNWPATYAWLSSRDCRSSTDLYSRRQFLHLVRRNRLHELDHSRLPIWRG